MAKEFLKFKSGVGNPLLERRINVIINEIFDYDGKIVDAINDFEDASYKGNFEKSVIYLATMKTVIEKLNKAIIRI